MPDAADSAAAPNAKTKADSVKPAESEDDKAFRAILASAAAGGNGGIDGPQIDVIPAVSEDDAYCQDVEEVPDSATLEDYDLVLVLFGAPARYGERGVHYGKSKISSTNINISIMPLHPPVP